MSKDPLVYIEDILEAIQKIEGYTAEVDQEEFLNNSEKQDAVFRRLEVIGEAVKSIPLKV